MGDSATPSIADHDVPAGAPGVAAPLITVDEGRRRTWAEEARTLVAGASAGTLATLEQDGAPWASVVAYGTLDDGSPVQFVSSLAAHGRNLEHDPRASLVVAAAATQDDVLASGRVTIAGTAHKPAGAAADIARDRFIAAVPTAKSYAGFKDFSLWVLRVEQVRWVGGYGRMGSTSAQEYADAAPDPIGPFAADAVAHLNADHGDSLLAMARSLAGHPDATGAQCHAIDGYGVDLFITTPRGFGLGRLPFAGHAHDRETLRAATVELAARARAAG